MATEETYIEEETCESRCDYQGEIALPAAMTTEEENIWHENLKPIKRSEFVEHNKECKASGKLEELWTVDSKRVYNGSKFYHRLESHIQFILDSISGSPKGNRLRRHKKVIERSKLFSQSMVFLQEFRLAKGLLDDAKHISAVGKIVEEANCQEITRVHLNQLQELTSMNGSEAVAYLSHLVDRCSAKHQTTFTNSTYANGLLRDLNLRTFTLPDGISPQILRSWKGPLPQLIAKLKPLVLATYDEFFTDKLPSITRRRFVDHNKECKSSGQIASMWTVDSKLVYNAYELQRCLLPFVKTSDAINRQRMRSKMQSEQLFNRVMYIYSQFNIPKDIFESVKQATVIGRITDDPENQERTKQEVNLLRMDLSQENKSGILPDFLHLLARYSNKLEYDISGYSAYTHTHLHNNTAFPLPEGIDPWTLREWTETWDPFDTKVEENSYVWSAPIEYKLDDLPDYHAFFAKYICPWADDFIPFDTEVDDDVPWEELPLDIVKNDLPTETQEELIKKRSKIARFYFSSRRAMLRDKLYEKLCIDESLTPWYNCKERIQDAGPGHHRDWAKNIDESWEAFQTLCKDWKPGYKATRTSEHPEPNLFSWPQMNSDAMEKRRRNNLKYFEKKYRKNNTHTFFLEPYRDWAIRMEHSWQQFQDICIAWHPGYIADRFSN